MKDLLDILSNLPLRLFRFIVIIAALFYFIVHVLYGEYTSYKNKKWIEEQIKKTEIKNAQIDGSKILIEKFPRGE